MKAKFTIIDAILEDYPKGAHSDIFISYNDAVLLAEEVRRLRRKIRKLES